MPIRPLRGPRSLLLASLAAVSVAACHPDAPQGYARMDPQYGRYADSLGVSIDRMARTPSGVYIRDSQVGSGPVAERGTLVSVHYTGWLPDGTRFDSSRDRGEPLEVPLGAGQVIPGWEEGILGMRQGGRRLMVIPSDLAYGPSGAGGVIPPNANLVFDVELVGVR